MLEEIESVSRHNYCLISKQSFDRIFNQLICYLLVDRRQRIIEEIDLSFRVQSPG